jgi:hypothetical protein
MLIITSVDKIPIRLTIERWQHILHRHPELETEENKILETVSSPDFVQEGDFNTKMAFKFYPQTPLTKKYLVVIYKEISNSDGFILTGYFTNQPIQRRRFLWKQ